MSDYGPIDILWLDGGRFARPNRTSTCRDWRPMAARQQPGLIIVDRTVGGRYENYLTPEQEVPDRPLPYAWETLPDDGRPMVVQAGRQVQVAPQADPLTGGHRLERGQLPLECRAATPTANSRPPHRQRLQEIGAWMQGQRRGDLRHAGDRTLQGRQRLVHARGTPSTRSTSPKAKATARPSRSAFPAYGRRPARRSACSASARR